MDITAAINLALRHLNTESPKIDAEFLLAKVLNKSFTWLKTWPEYELSEQQEILYREMIKRRQKGEPVAYITGERAFWTLNLETNASTLIPRSETELLVETALEFLENKKSAKVLDLGTGTGAIALALASERYNDRVFASDFHPQAVKLAKGNAHKNKIDNIEIIQSDWFSNIREDNFDLIVSNPPYVEAGDPHLSQGDLVFEPDSALIAGDCGLADIKTIVKETRSFLVSGGGLMIEHGFEQGEQVRAIFLESGFTLVNTIADLAGLDRVTTGIYTTAA